MLMEHLSNSTARVPEQSGSKSWRRLVRWLGLGAVHSQWEENGSVSGGTGDQLSKGDKEKKFRNIAEEVPEFLELGPQRYGDPGFWGPDVDGPLLADASYRQTLKTLSRQELPSETIERSRPR
jgi:hypothetical protein